MLIRSIALCLISFGVLLSRADAQSITGIQIIEYGIYTAKSAPLPDRSQGGVARLSVDSLCHIATTLAVPARLGLYFGFRYKVQGSLPGELADLTMTVRFPAPIQPPGMPSAFTVDKFATQSRVGAVKYTGFNFGSDGQLVQGIWRFELSHGGRKLAEMAFEVVDGARVLAPPDDNSACFPVA